MSDPVGEQPRPTPRPGVESVQARVRVDLEARERLGYASQPTNGRYAVRAAYEEALDLACYLRQVVTERQGEGERGWKDEEYRIDGDLLADIIVGACPAVLSEDAARATAERALVSLAAVAGVTVLRGTNGQPWTPEPPEAHVCCEHAR